jgi:hypothetical protein
VAVEEDGSVGNALAVAAAVSNVLQNTVPLIQSTEHNIRTLVHTPPPLPSPEQILSTALQSIIPASPPPSQHHSSALPPRVEESAQPNAEPTRQGGTVATEEGDVVRDALSTVAAVSNVLQNTIPLAQATEHNIRALVHTPPPLPSPEQIISTALETIIPRPPAPSQHPSHSQSQPHSSESLLHSSKHILSSALGSVISAPFHHHSHPQSPPPPRSLESHRSSPAPPPPPPKPIVTSFALPMTGSSEPGTTGYFDDTRRQRLTRSPSPHFAHDPRHPQGEDPAHPAAGPSRTMSLPIQSPRGERHASPLSMVGPYPYPAAAAGAAEEEHEPVMPLQRPPQARSRTYGGQANVRHSSAGEPVRRMSARTMSEFGPRPGTGEFGPVYAGHAPRESFAGGAPQRASSVVQFPAGQGGGPPNGQSRRSTYYDHMESMSMSTAVSAYFLVFSSPGGVASSRRFRADFSATAPETPERWW